MSDEFKSSESYQGYVIKCLTFMRVKVTDGSDEHKAIPGVVRAMIGLRAV